MTELLTSAQMRAIEQAAIDSGEVTGLELMERAGRGVVDAIFEEWPELAQVPQAERGASPASSIGRLDQWRNHERPPEYLQNNEKDWLRRAVVLCGPGNNGGDGFVVARLLSERGWAVEVFLYGDPETLPPDARVNYERWVEMGEVAALCADDAVTSVEPDLVVDALFGTGLRRPIEDIGMVLLDLTEETGRANYFDFPNCRVTSVDLPSGLCSDSGKSLIHKDDIATTGGPLPAVQSQLTVTFHSRKWGHLLADGPGCCGRVVVKDIGLKSGPAVPPGDVVRLVEHPTSDFGKSDFDHKYTHGHALILSGGLGKTGAARLAARGALRIGAGLVTVGSPGEGLAENAAQLTAIMLRGVEDATALAETLKDDRINVLCLGPGLGLDRARDLVPVALAGKGRAVVLDADTLTAFADAPAVLFAMLHENCVLTPHAGEFARLFPDIAEKLNAPATKGPAYSKVDATREAAKRAGCVVLFKGADTVIAGPDGRCSINAALYDRAAPWLATAGSGDVLAGFITGLLARGLAPMHAAEAAAWLHVECALTFGPGLIAEDLPEQLPQVFRDLGL